jgi:hypothetical protein
MGLIKPKVKVRGPKIKMPKVKVSLARCGNCGAEYSNPLAHVCKKKASRTAKQTRKGR